MWRPGIIGLDRAVGASSRADRVPSAVSARPALIGADHFPRLVVLDQLFIVRALILRDLRIRYKDNPFGFIMEFFRIVVVVAGHYTAFSIKNKAIPSGCPIETFVIAGFSTWFTFSRSLSAAAHGADWPAGASRLPGVTRMHLRLAKTIWAVVAHLLFALGAVLVLNLFGDDLPLFNVPFTVLLLGLAGFLGFGYGLFVDGMSIRFPVVTSMTKTFKWALFITGGVYFSISLTPGILGEVFWFNPVLHILEFQRHSFEPGYPLALVTLLYPAGVGAVLLLFGLIINRWLREQDLD